jgi:hypothetical protein
LSLGHAQSEKVSPDNIPSKGIFLLSVLGFKLLV